MEMLKLLSASELVSQIICFLIFLGIMRVFLWDKFLGIIEKRRDSIASELKKVDEDKEAIARIKADYQQRLSDIDTEAKIIMREATVRAHALADEIRSKSQKDAERIIENAKVAIQDELTKAKDDLKGTIVDLSIQVAEKVIQERLSEKSDKQLVENFIKEVCKK